MSQTLAQLILASAGAGVFTAAMIGETIPEIVGTLAGALLGMLVVLGSLLLQSSPVQLTGGSVLAALVAALWASMLAWLAVVWWENLTGRVPPGGAG
ncbi:MAG: hypothetical protein ACRDIC_04780 [bacterium]